MSANPHWEVALARSSDLQEIDGLPYAFSLSPIFNRPGSLSMTLPLDADVAYQVVKHSTCVTCQRNDQLRWSGEIVAVVKDPQAMTLSLTATGWLDILNHRFVRPEEEASLVFVDQVGGEIARSLLAVANAQTDTSGIVRPTRLTFGSAQDTQTRTRAYKRSQSFGAGVQELSDIENGFDIFVDPLTRAVTTRAPDAFQRRGDVIFEYGVNLANAPQTDDGSSSANRINVVGSNGLVFAADDPAVIDAQGVMREDWLSVSDVSDETIIGAYANAELVYREHGTVSYDLKPLPYGDVPRLWDDFELGDAQGNEIITQIGTAPTS
jgi:azurin